MTRGDVADRVLALLPGGVTTVAEDGAIEIADEADPEQALVVCIFEDAIELRLPTVVWQGQSPEPTTRLWKRVPTGDHDLATEELARLIERAKRARKREWATCRFCHERVPVEHRIDADTCHGCATTHLGVVF